jgi:hypothetical protein
MRSFSIGQGRRLVVPNPFGIRSGNHLRQDRELIRVDVA